MKPPKRIAIYRKCLLELGYGCPIYEPDPGRYEHVQIGDVGYVESRSGHFHRVFNAFYGAEAPINRFGIPIDFEPIAQDLREWVMGADLPSGAHCRHIKIDKSVGFSLEG